MHLRSFQQQRFRAACGMRLLVAAHFGHAEKHGLRACAQVGKGGFHGVTAQKVVAVYKGHVFARGCLDAGVARPGHAAVLPVEDARVFVRAGEFVADAPACVGGTVVHQHDFQMFCRRLLRERAQAARQVFFHIVNGHDHADHARPGGAFPPGFCILSAHNSKCCGFYGSARAHRQPPGPGTKARPARIRGA